MEKQKPLISIVTVCFNSSTTIKKTIESVLIQNSKNIEYIIIDGNSSDRTLTIIKSFQEQFQQKEIPYKWISEPDRGIYDAFNKGIKLSKGKWISFLGSDDIYIKNAIALYEQSIMRQRQRIDLIYSKVQLERGKVFNGVWSWKKFRRKMNIAHVGALHNMDFFKEYGLFDTSYKIAGDYELLLRAKDKLKTIKFNEITVIMADGGVSNSQIKETYKETTRAKLETAKVSKFICMLDYYIWILKYKVKMTMNEIIR